jgi:hypothetical protein
MIKRVLIAALVFAAPACLVSAQDARVSVDMIGIGVAPTGGLPKSIG